jgi:uncharacterized protein YchJ
MQGEPIDNAERLLRVRYSALVNHNVKFLWETSHPSSPRKLNDTWSKFERDLNLLRNLNYTGIKILDEDTSKKDKTIIVYWVQVREGEHDLSYLEEAVFQVFEGRWYYYDGLRRSSNRLGCLPESVRIGDLEILFPHASQYN